MNKQGQIVLGSGVAEIIKLLKKQRNIIKFRIYSKPELLKKSYLRVERVD